MTQFALVYEAADLQEIATRFSEALAANSAMTGQQRNRLNAYWSAGLSTWQTVPVGDFPQYNCRAAQGCKAIVVNLANGSKADFVSLMRQIVARMPAASVSYFNAVVDDMESAGIVEPWP